MSKVKLVSAAVFAAMGVLCRADSVPPQSPERVREIAGCLRPEAGFAETRIGNRAAWERVAGIDPKATRGAVASAERIIAQPMPAVDDADYAKIYPWNRPHAKRYGQLAPLTLAECLENKGRFLPRITEILEAISAMRTWVNPYHDRPDFKSFNGKWRKLDLGNGQTVEALALAVDVLRDRLPADCVRRATAAARAQTLDVYLEIAREGSAAAKRNGCSGWYGGLYNWNAACCSYFTTASILLLDDPIERAEAIELAERSTARYLAGFTREGLSLEGASYWDYGFGRYLRLGIDVRRATGGKIPFFPEPRARKCFLSGYDVLYDRNGMPCYGDCGGMSTPDVPWTLGGMVWPDLASLDVARAKGVFFGGLYLTTVRSFGTPGVSSVTPTRFHDYPIRTWYEDQAQQLVCRPVGGRGLFASFKGGSNGAGHNHNDVGVFCVAIDGREVVGDPGNKKYDLDTFGPKRYESNLRNSYGHPVPLVDGTMQSTGARAAAKLIRTDFSDAKDVVELDLRDAYDVARLKCLKRTFTYFRESGRVVVRDEVAFDGTGAFESPFVTFGTVERLADGAYKVTSKDGRNALVCRVRATGGELVTREETLEDTGLGRGAPRRFAFAFREPVGTATLEMTWERAQGGGEGWKMFDRRLGMFVHWGIYSVDGYHEQQRMRQRLGRTEYAGRVKGFAAEKFDPYRWIDVAESAGAEYIVFTAKHHDGFCMWDTRETDFKVTNSPAGRDVLKELADACRRRGMKLGLYYSNPDWNHPNAYNPQSSHQVPPEAGDVPDMEKYRAYVKAQITELLTGYGEIVCLFWDIPTKISAPEMDELVRKLQPGIRINDRGWGNAGDYSTPERGIPDGAAFTRPTEACDSVGAQSWGYRAHEDYHTVGYLTRAIDRTLARGGNFLLNVGPKSDGTIPAESAALMAGVGAWYSKVRESYRDVETLAGLVGDTGCILTGRGETLYLHYANGLTGTGVDLKPLMTRPGSAVVLNTGASLESSVEKMPRNWREGGESLHLRGIPADELAGESIVIRLSGLPAGRVVP